MMNRNWCLIGYVAFLDPPKESAGPAIAVLQKHGVTVKILTGDNDLVTKKVCHDVGLSTDRILLGADIEAMSDEKLAEAVETTHIFARLSPAHKQRIVQALRAKGSYRWVHGRWYQRCSCLARS